MELEENKKKKKSNIENTIKKLSRDNVGSIPPKRVELSAKDKLKNRHPKHKKKICSEDVVDN